MREGGLILPTDIVPDLDKFLGCLGLAPGKFGAQLFTMVYEEIFIQSRDLKEQYDKFYSVEYSSFADYLEMAHDIKLDASALEKKYVFVIGGLSGVVDQAYDENVLNQVFECVARLEEACNED